ncbi:unnamed protein product, partial [Prunus brigantina]
VPAYCPYVTLFCGYELRALTLAYSLTHLSSLVFSLPLTHIGDDNCHLLRTHIGDGDLTLSLSAAVLHLHLSLSVTYFNRRSSPLVRQISQFSSAFLKSIYLEMTSQVPSLAFHLYFHTHMLFGFSSACFNFIQCSRKFLKIQILGTLFYLSCLFACSECMVLFVWLG